MDPRKDIGMHKLSKIRELYIVISVLLYLSLGQDSWQQVHWGFIIISHSTLLIAGAKYMLMSIVFHPPREQCTRILFTSAVPKNQLVIKSGKFGIGVARRRPYSLFPAPWDERKPLIAMAIGRNGRCMDWSFMQERDWDQEAGRAEVVVDWPAGRPTGLGE